MCRLPKMGRLGGPGGAFLGRAVSHIHRALVAATMTKATTTPGWLRAAVVAATTLLLLAKPVTDDVAASAMVGLDGV